MRDSIANAPSRGALWARLCLKYGVRQDFLDWRALPFKTRTLEEDRQSGLARRRVRL